MIASTQKLNRDLRLDTACQTAESKPANVAYENPVMRFPFRTKTAAATRASVTWSIDKLLLEVNEPMLFADLPSCMPYLDKQCTIYVAWLRVGVSPNPVSIHNAQRFRFRCIGCAWIRSKVETRHTSSLRNSALTSATSIAMCACAVFSRIRRTSRIRHATWQCEMFDDGSFAFLGINILCLQLYVLSN